MSFGEALHVMHMLKLTAQTASFGRAQHWRVGMGMGSETRTPHVQHKGRGYVSGPLTPPSLPLPGNSSPTDHRINLLQKESARPVSCQIGRGGSPSNTLGTCGAETGSPELLAAWRRRAAQGPMGQERHWAEVVRTWDKEVGKQTKMMVWWSRCESSRERVNVNLCEHLNPRLQGISMW